MIDLFAVWTLPSVTAALIGGFLLGLLFVSLFENPRFTATETIGVMLILGLFAGLVFWLAQIADTLLADGPEFAWRVVSRFGLWCLFVLAMAVGTGLGVRFRSRRRR